MTGRSVYHALPAHHGKQRVSPGVLGALAAFHEHSALTQGVLLDMNPFDQFGGEFGKVLATRTHAELRAEAEPRLAHDSSTNALIRRYRERRGRR